MAMDERVSDMLRPIARRMLLVRTAERATLGGIVGGAAAVAVMLVSLLLERQQVAMWAALLLPAGMLVAAGWTVAAGLSPWEAARFLDRRCSLRERLTTAVELEQCGTADMRRNGFEGGGPYGPRPVSIKTAVPRVLHRAHSKCAAYEVDGDVSAASQYVCRQARQAVCDLPGRLPLWTAGRRRLGLLLVAAVLVTGLAAVAAAGSQDTTVQRLLAMLDGATQARRDAVAEGLRQASRREADPQTVERLREAARLVELRDEQQLREVLEQLERAGFEVGRALPGDIAAEIGAAGATDDTAAADDRDSQGELQPGDDDPLRVFDPAYAATAGDATEDSAASAPPTTTFDDAWSAARQRAAESLHSGSLPAEYRAIVQRFYDLQLTTGE